MKRPIVYDLSHLTHRLAFEAPVGIDRVDLAFARHFGLAEGKIAATLRYGRKYPRVLAPSSLADVVRRVERRWRECSPVETDAKYLRIRAWITGDRDPSAAVDVDCRNRARLKGATGVWNSSPAAAAAARFKRWISAATVRRFHAPRAVEGGERIVPDDAIYLNVAQHALETAAFFEWLTPRKDVQCVFFLHDLLPLDYPEFWWPGHQALFSRRIDTMFRHATALITSSDVVRERACRELEARGRPPLPIFSCPLPSPIGAIEASTAYDAELVEHPYFVIIGTIEPRKNHALLFNVWRRLAARGGAVPKLVVVGNRGWENEQALDMLERCASISAHVREIAGLSNAGVAKLLANARALLMPSFAEGYGLPLVEALGLGAPVVASEIPVFHEVTQEKAIFRDPIDGLGWSEAIEALSDLQSPAARAAREAARTFRAKDSETYFSAVEDFLTTL
jgi:glycosyltransferase involved in cell wall biosynthesis